jgi:uncharacterized membrane protein YkvA (DUF1232 family)
MAEPPARFGEFRRRAEAMLEHPARLKTLVGQVADKITRLGGPRLRELREQVSVALDMVAAWLSGDYRQVSNKTMVILVAALLYFVVPFDVIPDFLFGWGYIDDAAVLTYVLGQLAEEVTLFKQWQADREQN